LFADVNGQEWGGSKVQGRRFRVGEGKGVFGQNGKNDQNGKNWEDNESGAVFA